MGTRHPVLDWQIDKARAADYEKAAERVLTMDEEDLLSFVPEHGYASCCECPSCYGGVQGSGIFDWSIDRPEVLKCRYCGEVALPNRKYEETHTLAGENRLGEEIRLPYYMNEDRHIPHFFSMHLLYYRRQWLLERCILLGKAYQVTGNEIYARSLVLVLDRFSQVYPHYPALHNRSSRTVRFSETQDPPFSWDAGRWGYFHNEIPKDVIAAYDMVFHSPEFDRLSEVRGYDIREKLVDDFFRKTYEVAAASTFHVGNVVGYDVTGVALLGRVIDDPGYVHRAFGWMKQNVDEGFFCDGWWHEAPSYHYMTVGGLRQAFDSVRGYSDPPGYVDPIDGTRLDDTNPEEELPFWRAVQRAPEALSFPNGASTPVHDTWAGEKRSEPRSRTASTIAPAYGHASLGRGVNGDQMQAQLHFGGTHGHHHFDNLNLTLFAKGSEMLPDLGYTWTQMRCWCAATAGHNLVVVDRADQNGRPSDGDLLWFFPDTNGVSVVEADGRRGYRRIKGVDMYRRILVMIPVSADDAYVVDIFRVRGGAVHDWALHGDADEDTTATCSLPLSGNRKWMLEPGEEWQEPTIIGARFNPYGMIRDVRKGETRTGFRTDFTYAGAPTKGVRVHMLPCAPRPDAQGQPAEVWLGRAPSVRRMGKGTSGDMRKGYDFWMPQLLVRRRGEAPLASTFAAVEEPYSGTPFIERIELVPLTPLDSHAVALRITHAGGVDTVISTIDAAPYPNRVTPDGVGLRGRLGVIRQTGGRSTGAWLFEGEHLAGGGWRLDTERARWEGVVESATRRHDGADHDAFTVTPPLPDGPKLQGLWMIVTHANGFKHGYEINRVETRNGKSTVVLTADHGLRIEGDTTREVYFPRRTIEGRNSFVIPLAASVAVD